jgi:hypothetical protein
MIPTAFLTVSVDKFLCIFFNVKLTRFDGNKRARHYNAAINKS